MAENKEDKKDKQIKKFRTVSSVLIIELEHLYKIDRGVAQKEYDAHFADFHKRAVQLLADTTQKEERPCPLSNYEGKCVLCEKIHIIKTAPTLDKSGEPLPEFSLKDLLGKKNKDFEI